jgi:heme-degrading monooxygenase HmoA
VKQSGYPTSLSCRQHLPSWSAALKIRSTPALRHESLRRSEPGGRPFCNGKRAGKVKVMITLEIKYKISPANAETFEKMIKNIYGPALAKQQGFAGYRLLREYSEAERKEIEATSDGYQFHLELTFENEALRRKWVASPEHDAAFEEAKKLAGQIVHNGYHVLQDSILQKTSDEKDEIRHATSEGERYAIEAHCQRGTNP